MSKLRFDVGTAVMCNMGPDGWKLGRVIAQHYREEHWPAKQSAPYQVALNADHSLIYVPEDEDRYCREASLEDTRIALRVDALAAPPGGEATELDRIGPKSRAQLGCDECTQNSGHHGYRDGQCHGCGRCPRNWSCAELYSEHYRCAERNGLVVTRRAVDLGTVRVGDTIHHHAGAGLPSAEGFLQCPTLVRLPPGVRFSDGGGLEGVVRFDPYRDARYRVEFVAVSTVDWHDPDVGLVRLEINFVVEGNDAPDGFDRTAFVREQRQARGVAGRCLSDLSDTWQQWEDQELDNRETCELMSTELRRLRSLLGRHPRLDGGRWWVQLGGFHMNVHKLLENTLFECELYLGHALTFGDPEVRRLAEANLEGCYHKRLLEAARFMWMEGVAQMMRGEWTEAVRTMRRAAAKKDGWGWAVNNGDIWLAESAARLVLGARLEASDGAHEGEGAGWMTEAGELLDRAMARIDEAGYFGPDGHPWASEIAAALTSYRALRGRGGDGASWLEAFELRTVYWCAQILGGAPPFPPQPRARREDAADLVRRLPGHNA